MVSAAFEDPGVGLEYQEQMKEGKITGFPGYSVET